VQVGDRAEAILSFFQTHRRLESVATGEFSDSLGDDEVGNVAPIALPHEDGLESIAAS